MTQVTALWRGEVPLAKTGWLYGLLGLLLLVTPVTLLGSFGLAHGAKPLLLTLSAVILLCAPFLAAAIWRSAGSYRGKFAWRLLAKGSVPFVALQIAVGLAPG